MKITVNHEGGLKEEINLGKFFRRVIWDLVKILAAIALALELIWIFVPAPRGLFLFYAPWACGVLYVLWEHLVALLPEGETGDGVRDPPDPRWPPG